MVLNNLLVNNKMTSEIKEGPINPNSFNNVRSRVEMQGKLTDLDRKRANVDTMSGLYMLSAELQKRLYSKNDMWPSQFSSALINARTEYGSRVGQTIIDRGTVNLEYEAGNLQAWLGGKGLEVSVNRNNLLNPNWASVTKIGDQEQNYYFDKQVLDPASFGVLAENVAGRFLNLAKEINEKSPNSVEAVLINMAASVQTAIAAEIGDMVNGGKGLRKEQVVEMIKPALNDIGMDLADKK
jgi:hypothetical protein